MGRYADEFEDATLNWYPSSKDWNNYQGYVGQRASSHCFASSVPVKDALLPLSWTVLDFVALRFRYDLVPENHEQMQFFGGLHNHLDTTKCVNSHRSHKVVKYE